MRTIEREAVRDVPGPVGGLGNWRYHLHVDPDKLWAFMQARGVTVEGLAVAVRKTGRTVFGWLSGTCSPPLGTLTYLAEALGVDPADLLYRKVGPKENPGGP